MWRASERASRRTEAVGQHRQATKPDQIELPSAREGGGAKKKKKGLNRSKMNLPCPSSAQVKKKGKIRGDVCICRQGQERRKPPPPKKTGTEKERAERMCGGVFFFLGKNYDIKVGRYLSDCKNTTPKNLPPDPAIALCNKLCKTSGRQCDPRPNRISTPSPRGVMLKEYRARSTRCPLREGSAYHPMPMPMPTTYSMCKVCIGSSHDSASREVVCQPQPAADMTMFTLTNLIPSVQHSRSTVPSLMRCVCVCVHTHIR